MGNQVSLNLMTLSVLFTVTIFITYFLSMHYVLYPDCKPIQQVTLALFMEVKWPKWESDHSSLSSTMDNSPISYHGMIFRHMSSFIFYVVAHQEI